MNNTGRPRNTSGSLYLRRDSRVWWMSYRDHEREVQTGVDRCRGKKAKPRRCCASSRVAGSNPAWVTI